MADWIECTGYTEAREKIWVNLDRVATITPHKNGSVLRFALSDGDGPFELVVWDHAQDILPATRDR